MKKEDYLINEIANILCHLDDYREEEGANSLSLNGEVSKKIAKWAYDKKLLKNLMIKTEIYDFLTKNLDECINDDKNPDKIGFANVETNSVLSLIQIGIKTKERFIEELLNLFNR